MDTGRAFKTLVYSHNRMLVGSAVQRKKVSVKMLTLQPSNQADITLNLRKNHINPEVKMLCLAAAASTFYSQTN